MPLILGAASVEIKRQLAQQTGFIWPCLAQPHKLRTPKFLSKAQA